MLLFLLPLGLWWLIPESQTTRWWNRWQASCSISLVQLQTFESLPCLGRLLWRLQETRCVPLWGLRKFWRKIGWKNTGRLLRTYIFRKAQQVLKIRSMCQYIPSYICQKFTIMYSGRGTVSVGPRFMSWALLLRCSCLSGGVKGSMALCRWAVSGTLHRQSSSPPRHVVG